MVLAIRRAEHLKRLVYVACNAKAAMTNFIEWGGFHFVDGWEHSRRTNVFVLSSVCAELHPTGSTEPLSVQSEPWPWICSPRPCMWKCCFCSREWTTNPKSRHDQIQLQHTLWKLCFSLNHLVNIHDQIKVNKIRVFIMWLKKSPLPVVSQDLLFLHNKYHWSRRAPRQNFLGSIKSNQYKSTQKQFVFLVSSEQLWPGGEMRRKGESTFLKQHITRASIKLRKHNPNTQKKKGFVLTS